MAEVVTSENLQEFNLARLAQTMPQEVEEAKIISETPAEEVKAEDAEDEPEDKPDEPPKKRNKIEERFSELTEQRRQALERAEAAEKRAAELESKVNPKPVEKIDNDVGPEPKPADYTDAFEYAKDLAKWSTDKALKDRDAQEAEKVQKAEAEKVMKGWQSRVEATKAELPDYTETLLGADNLSVSDDVRDALIESELGPRILYHLAKNPDEVAKINDMSVRGALRYIGKLEAQFEKPQKEEKKEPEVKIARVAPPEPIKPIRASSGADNKVDNQGEFQGTYSQWKALRKAGKV